MSTQYQQWFRALRELTSTPEAAQKYHDQRYAFSSAVARLLTESLPPCGRDQVIYAVWLHGHQAPVYLGSTTEARRRLWDLPVGESHHLSNTFPPELWSRVQVLFWHEVLEEAEVSVSELARAAAAQVSLPDDKGIELLGLGFEHQFQAQYLPRFNSRKKRRDGTWREVAFEASTSRPARLRALLGEAHVRLDSAWQQLLGHTADSPPLQSRQGCVVYPQLVLASRFEGTT